MANLLKTAQVQTVLTLRARGWSYRRISRELGVHREIVKRYVEHRRPRRLQAETRRLRPLAKTGQTCPPGRTSNRQFKTGQTRPPGPGR